MSEINVTQHDLGAEDYDEIIDLWRRAGLHVRATGREAPEAFARQLTSGLQRVVGLRLAPEPGGGAGLLVAVAVLTHDGRKGWINRLAVDPGYRRHGLAARLIAEAERWFRDDLDLEVYAALIYRGNHASRALFQQLGYEPVDVVYVAKRMRPDA